MQFLHIQITSVSGHSVHFIYKTCQIVAGTSIMCQFHEFFNLILAGFLTFGSTVPRSSISFSACCSLCQHHLNICWQNTETVGTIRPNCSELSTVFQPSSVVSGNFSSTNWRQFFLRKRQYFYAVSIKDVFKTWMPYRF